MPRCWHFVRTWVFILLRILSVFHISPMLWWSVFREADQLKVLYSVHAKWRCLFRRGGGFGVFFKIVCGKIVWVCSSGHWLSTHMPLFTLSLGARKVSFYHLVFLFLRGGGQIAPLAPPLLFYKIHFLINNSVAKADQPILLLSLSYVIFLNSFSRTAIFFCFFAV